MGQCISVSPSVADLPDLQSTLRTGDIVLLLDGSKTSKYLIKAGGSAGGWARASKIGFLVRNQHSGELFIYHADDHLPSAPGMTRIIGRSLTEELHNNSNYRLAIVRRLRTPLSPQKEALVEDFVGLNNGAIIPEQLRPSSVLMASSSSPTQAFEHLDCSDFVMMMLHLVGLVEPTNNPFEYVATDSRGRLLAPPVAIKIRSNSTTSTISSATTTGASTTTSQSEHQQHVYDSSQLHRLSFLNEPSAVSSLSDGKILVSTDRGKKRVSSGDHSNDSSTNGGAEISPTSVIVNSKHRFLKSATTPTNVSEENTTSAPTTPLKNNN